MNAPTDEWGTTLEGKPRVDRAAMPSPLDPSHVYLSLRDKDDKKVRVPINRDPYFFLFQNIIFFSPPVTHAESFPYLLPKTTYDF